MIIHIDADETSIANNKYADSQELQEVVFDGENIEQIGIKALYNCAKLDK